MKDKGFWAGYMMAESDRRARGGSIFDLIPTSIQGVIGLLLILVGGYFFLESLYTHENYAVF